MEINKELLQKYSEHNNGILYDLKEISLHLLNIEEINLLLSKYCPKLEILLLQGNKIKEITVNQISKIQNINKCEELRKLDLSCNFISFLSLNNSIPLLQELYKLESLYLLGNPCAKYSFYRKYLIHFLPHLKELDGKEIEEKEFLQSKKLSNQEIKEIINNIELNQNQNQNQNQFENLNQNQNQIQIQNQNQNQIKKLIQKKKRIYQKNEGNWFFHFKEIPKNKSKFQLVVEISKLISTQEIQIKLQKEFIFFKIQEQELILKLPSLVKIEDCNIKRKMLTGNICVEFTKKFK